ncbi:MAG: DNA polymerase III subunit delta [Bacilli bacterium]
MIYLLYGLEDYLIFEQIKKITKENDINKFDISQYDIDNTKLEKIIDDALTMPLFGEKKLILVENSYIFTANNSKKGIKQNTEILEQYIKNINPNTILIFYIFEPKLDARKKLVVLLKTKGQIVEFEKGQNINNFIKKQFENYIISDKQIELLKNRIGENLYILVNEIEKIKVYKNENLKIEDTDIFELTNKNINTDIFLLIENIINNNKSDAIESYNEIIKMGEEPIKIIVMLANQFRIMYQSKQLIKKGYLEKDIASMLGVHPYRIKLGLEKSKNYKDQQLLNIIEKLADLDSNIKLGKIDKNIGLELFILS